MIGDWGSDGAAVRLCAAPWSACEVFDSFVTSESSWLSLAGSWTAAAVVSRARGFRRRRGILAGNGESGTDSQGTLNRTKD